MKGIGMNEKVLPPAMFTRELLWCSPIPWHNNMTGPRFLSVRGAVHRAANLTGFRTHMAPT